ncbi:tannase/feruloyl esterase family alpha/beta hydrolase [Nonomuraea aurantiaca]|uniref:tannase/feruloyl esterase family alpha/beta hydrolase n=1 Tax=Nonomuraea aurantiaca TaxID=2878562 RepID=UPI001CDA070F|nr:tannase/feruloyl esterase family alpha/beta hydrolase [Nonomuraea aurantiaca]MCA2226067.1 tannase/feruloyl esterase family alpha/beta hydrolase [Nonomuraea aurantiaca]
MTRLRTPAGKNARLPHLGRLVAAIAAVLSMAIPLNARPSAASVTAAESGTCEGLTAMTLPDATVTLAESVPAGRYTSPDGRVLPSVPAFCRVHGVAKPVPNSSIGFEVWIPQQGWNQRLLMFGNGGYSSAIDFPSMGGLALSAGYATVGTDTGHTGDDPDVFRQGAANPEIIVDWGHRAVHETIVNAKPIVEAYTGAKPRYSYFIGCSTGGHQALMEAQRYPDDFDGIVAGAPGNNRVALNAGFLWQFLRNHTPGSTSDPIVPAAKLPLLTSAAVKRCRGGDGGLATDDFLTDPRRCSFDPASLRCPAGDAPTCLTKRQVQALREMYAGARDPRTGEQIYPGWPVGSEAPVVDAAGTVRVGWSAYWGTTEPARANFWRYWVFNDPNWNWWTFDFHRDLRLAQKKLGPIINATDPDLRPFRRSGGKLIMYTGWADPVVSAHDTIDYFRQVVRATSGERQPGSAAVARTREFARLFMVPGMAHCGGGPGPNVFDKLTPIVNWVERGAAPAEIVATKYVHDNPADGVAMTRPLRPFTCQP